MASPFWLQTPASQGAEYRARFVLVRASSVALVVLPLSVLCSGVYCLGLLNPFLFFWYFFRVVSLLLSVLCSGFYCFGLSWSFSIFGYFFLLVVSLLHCGIRPSSGVSPSGSLARFRAPSRSWGRLRLGRSCFFLIHTTLAVATSSLLPR